MDESSETPRAVARGVEFRGKRAASNSLYSMVGIFFVVLIALVTTPLLVNRLGVAGFGFVSLTTAVLGYITIIDPGFSDLVTRYGAQARVRGETHVAARICALGSLVWLAFGAVIAPLVILLSPIVVRHIPHINHSLIHSATDFAYWSFFMVIFSSIQATLSARLLAVGDQWIVTIIDVTTRFIYAAVLVDLLLQGWRISAVVVATSVQYVLAYVATIIMVALRDGLPYANPWKLNRTHLREISRFGGWLQLSGLLETLTYETDALVVGFLVGLKSTGLWAITNRVARQITYLAYIPQSNVLPGMSAAFVSDEGIVGLRRIYERANRIIVLLGAFFAGVVIAFGPILLEAWLGNPFAKASAATVLAALAMAAGLPRPATANAILAMGRVGYGVRAQLLAFVINAVLTLSLVGPLGLNGVLIGTVMAKMVATNYLLLRFSRLVESNYRTLVWQWLGPIILITAVTASLGRLAMYYWPSAHRDRLTAYVAIAILGTAYSLLYFVGLRVVRYFSVKDLTWLREAVPAKLGHLISPTVVRMLTGARP